jgi:23S rRNA (adenine2503-C2)-methyltransferase
LSQAPSATAFTESPYRLDPDDLATLFPGEPPFRSRQLRDWLYRNPVLTAEAMTNLPLRLRAGLAHRLWPFSVDIAQSADGSTTRKWLFRAAGGASIEAVLMGYPHRATLCISSQAGCAMGCTFCATGQFGFERHLDAGEIVAQLAYAEAHVRANPFPTGPDRVTNIVFMGMGEPLANYRNLREALRRMIETMGRSARSITVSTVGVVPGILRLAEEPWAVNLAISLHAADDELRSRLVPLNDRYPLADVVASAKTFFAAKGRRVSIEWALMDGVNDTPDQATKLAGIAHDLRAHINVINLNPTPLSPHRPAAASAVDTFVTTLQDRGANVTVRDTRGKDIDAACGQLRLRAAETSTLPDPAPPTTAQEEP